MALESDSRHNHGVSTHRESNGFRVRAKTLSTITIVNDAANKSSMQQGDNQ